MKRIYNLLWVVMAVVAMTSCYDDDDLWTQVNALDTRVTNLESTVQTMNDNIVILTGMASTLRQSQMILKYEKQDDGYLLTFTDGKSIVLKNGTNGKDAPVVGIKEDNGVYYWTITTDNTTEWLVDTNGNKLATTGITPIMGVDKDGYWTVDIGGGATQVKDVNGNAIQAKGEAGDSFFKSVTETDSAVQLTLASGTVITMPKAGVLGINFTNFYGGFKVGETKTFSYTLTNADDCTLFAAPTGWDVSLKENELTVVAPTDVNATGDIKVVISDEDGNLKMVKLPVYIVKVMDFEGSAWSAYIPALDYYDPLIYGTGYGSSVDYKWEDTATKLAHEFPSVWGSTNYMGAGIAISNKIETDLTNGDYNHELAVPVATGGNNGSKNFAVHHGNSDGINGVDKSSLPNIYFSDNEEYVIDNMYVCSTTYLLNCMKVGNTYTPKLGEEDEVFITATGYDKNGNSTGEVKFYLAKDGQFVEDWTPFSLAELGKVNKVYFNVDGSKSTYGAYGFGQPAYFAFDDVAVRY